MIFESILDSIKLLTNLYLYFFISLALNISYSHAKRNNSQFGYHLSFMNQYYNINITYL